MHTMHARDQIAQDAAARGPEVLDLLLLGSKYAIDWLRSVRFGDDLQPLVSRKLARDQSHDTHSERRMLFIRGACWTR